MVQGRCKCKIIYTNLFPSYLVSTFFFFTKWLYYTTVIIRSSSCIHNLFSTHHHPESMWMFLLNSTLYLSPFEQYPVYLCLCLRSRWTIPCLSPEADEQYPALVQKADEQYLYFSPEAGEQYPISYSRSWWTVPFVLVQKLMLNNNTVSFLHSKLISYLKIGTHKGRPKFSKHSSCTDPHLLGVDSRGGRGCFMKAGIWI